MSIRFYHQTGRRSAVSVGPVGALLIFPFYIGWLGVLLLFWTGYAAFWALSWLISVGALAFAGLHRDSAFADELAAFVSSPSIRAWWAGRADRSARRARQRADRPTEPLPELPETPARYSDRR